MKRNIARFALLVAGFVVSTPLSSCAQDIRKSQLATVSQMIGTARIEIMYRRPVARGRDLCDAALGKDSCADGDQGKSVATE